MEDHKYPAKIQRLFASSLPLLYKPPPDYAPEHRATTKTLGVAKYLTEVEDYKASHPSQPKERPPPPLDSFQRQLNEWNDPQLVPANLKDPYRTVFVSRLDYAATELNVSETLGQYGSIESVTLIRDRNDKPRGYGFVVFERDIDAKTCVRELAPTGITIGTRLALVDMERGRIVRNWMPRRLGGGLGGRHYTRPNALPASAAASGRRLNLSTTPYPQKRTASTRAPEAKRPAYDDAAERYSRYRYEKERDVRADPRATQAASDKYAKYARYSTDTRLIRSIRRD